MKNPTLYTRLKWKRKADIEAIVDLAVDWCAEKWGVNGRRREPLVAEVNWEERHSMGQYDHRENLITVFAKANLNVRDLVDTVIHEFTHQRQKMSQYHRVLKSSGYCGHPMEIEAYRLAKENRKQCWHDIKKKMAEKPKPRVNI